MAKTNWQFPGHNLYYYLRSRRSKGRKKGKKEK